MTISKQEAVKVVSILERMLLESCSNGLVIPKQKLFQFTETSLYKLSDYELISELAQDYNLLVMFGNHVVSIVRDVKVFVNEPTKSELKITKQEKVKRDKTLALKRSKQEPVKPASNFSASSVDRNFRFLLASTGKGVPSRTSKYKRQVDEHIDDIATQMHLIYDEAEPQTFAQLYTKAVEKLKLPWNIPWSELHSGWKRRLEVRFNAVIVDFENEDEDDEDFSD